MDTPICDYVKQYLEKKMSRFHMPGHKGKDSFSLCEPYDITEMEGADDLYHANGIILKSEQNASSLFGSRHTFYSTEGSSLCIRAMLYLALQYALPPLYPPTSASARPSYSAIPRRRIIAARNAHKTFLYACALLDLDVIWLYPEPDRGNRSTTAGAIQSGSADSICSCPISPESLQACLEQLNSLPEEERPFAVFLTSPDYLGGLQDIAGLSAVCHRFGIPLLVDNAHGAYLKFLSPSLHPLDLGADMCCDSAHKTLPALTGCAYLHISKDARQPYEQDARIALSLFGSTSPSYLLLQSLDRCNAYLAEHYQQPDSSLTTCCQPSKQKTTTCETPNRLADCLAKRESVCQMLSQRGFSLLPSDPLRIVFDAAASVPGYTGLSLAACLRSQQMECEYADQDYVVLMVTPENSSEDWERLQHLKLPAPLTAPEHLCGTLPQPFPTPTTTRQARTFTIATALSARTSAPALSIRQALFSRNETIPVEKAIGRICATPVVSCPPAIPLVVSGERITQEDVMLCRYYGIEALPVVL